MALATLQNHNKNNQLNSTRTNNQPVAATTSGRIQETVIASDNNRLHQLSVDQGKLISFTTQLSVMLESGVALSDAMDAIAAQEDNENFQTILEDVAHRIKSGEKFSTALAQYKRAFNSMFVSMVKTSEASGNTAQMLNILSGYLTFESETRKRIKRALTYPFVMALVAVAATATLLFFVLPRFMKIYESRGASLPKITQMLVTFSQTIRDIDVMAVVLTTSVMVTMAAIYWTKSTAGRKVLDYFKISTPIISSMFIDTVIARSMRIMATMVSTGVNLLEAIEVMEGSCDNFYFQRLWRQVDQKIRNGYQLSEAITLSEGSELIAPGIIQMLKAGEKSGKLGHVCDKISVYYENKLHGSINNVTTLIEPLMITVLGVIIGTIAIALLLPVFRISSVVAQ